MRYIYSLLLYLIAPFIPLYLKRRARKNPHYALFWHERFGINLVNNITKPIIWIHAVSVGETRAMAKLVEILGQTHPEYQILITQMTPTGRETAKNLYPNAVLHYVPYDLPHAVINFYKTFKPKLGLIMETEIWPNLIHYAAKFKIPLFLINARLSDRSFSSYHKVKWLIRPILNKFVGILAQDKSSATNFANLGFNRQLQIIGNTKFDIIIDEKNEVLSKWLGQNLEGKKVVVFSSTREGEEKLILDSLPTDFTYLVVIIPRHPERFMPVERLIQSTGLAYQKRSDNEVIRSKTKIFLGDSLGEMFAYYLMADLAVIGGSFLNTGGQNLIEAIYCNKPVLFGPSMFNFAQIAENALKDQCAVQVQDTKECFEIINKIFNNINEYKLLQNNCEAFIGRYKGASQLILQTVEMYL